MFTRIERNAVQPPQGLNEEPTRSSVPGPLPSMDNPGQAGPAFQGVDEIPTNAERQIPEGLESQFARMNILDDNRHERRHVILDGHVITAEPSLDPSTDQQSSRPPANMAHGDAVAFIRVVLQVAVAGLKAAPIPDLDRIPRTLLLLIESYEVGDPAILPGALRQH